MPDQTIHSAFTPSFVLERVEYGQTTVGTETEPWPSAWYWFRRAGFEDDRRGKRIVTMREFEDAKDKVMMGAERRTLVMTDDEKRLTAYHEAGHAVVALNVPATDPVHKATIIPRGRALGMVMQLPERDKLSMSYEQMTSRLAIMMGGRIAEEMIFGKDKVTSGAQSDIEPIAMSEIMDITE